MQRVKQMFRRFLLWIGAASLLFGLSACGQTTADTYAMPTDVERLFTTASQLEAATQSAQDDVLPNGSYVWEYTSEDENLTLSVDAPVSVPAATPAMRHVTAGGFTQAQITAIFNYLYAGQTATTVIGENVQTRAELQTQLDRMNQTLADGGYTQLGFTKSEYEEAIRRQEEACRNAPTASSGERVETDGTMLTVRDANSGDYQALSAQNEANDTLVVRSAAADDRSQLPSSCVFDRYDAPEYNMLDAVSIEAGDALPEYARGRLATTYDDAKSLSDGLFSSAGVDVSLLAAFVVGDRQTGNTDGIVQDAVHYAYEFQYLRVIGDVPVASDSWEDDGGASGFPWDQEEITVIVDDEGIARVRWVEPVAAQDDATECADVLSFPQAQEIFEKMVPIVYGAQTSSLNPKIDRIQLDIKVSQVQLCLQRVKDQTAESKYGLLVPSWVFYGDIVTQTFWKDGTTDTPSYRQGMNGASGCDFSPGPTIVFAVNAVDGSVIDTSLGY